METDVRLNSRPAEMSVKDRLGRLQPHSLVIAVEQLGQALDCARRQLRQQGSQAVGRLWPAARIAAGASHPVTEAVTRHENLQRARRRMIRLASQRGSGPLNHALAVCAHSISARAVSLTWSSARPWASAASAAALNAVSSLSPRCRACR